VIFGHAFACVHVSGLLLQPRLLAKMVSAGGRSKQSSDLDRPLLGAVYLPLRIERSRPSLSVSCKVGPAGSAAITGDGGIDYVALAASNAAALGLDVVVVAGVPEASTWAMMLIGFAGLGGAAPA
jgi:hypothetical protein